MINKLSSKTSFPYDGISTKLLKTITNATMRYITIIINEMLNTRILLDKLKIAKVIPIYKKCECSTCCDHRHIGNYRRRIVQDKPFTLTCFY